jgi:hypothetical protein
MNSVVVRFGKEVAYGARRGVGARIPRRMRSLVTTGVKVVNAPRGEMEEEEKTSIIRGR